MSGIVRPSAAPQCRTQFRRGHRAGTLRETHWLALGRQTVEELIGQSL